MPSRVPDYNQLASSYDTRFETNRLSGIEAALRDLVARVRPRSVLDVGCGTGRWLAVLGEAGAVVTGLDASKGMLARAAEKRTGASLIAGRANELPFRGRTFDLITCVMALHHFRDPRAFVAEAGALLRPGGKLAVTGIDPRAGKERYVWEFFPGTRESDLRKYPSFGQLVDWFIEAGLSGVELRVAETWRSEFVGEQVLDDPFLRKDSNSTLALLDEDVYSEGVERLRLAAARQPNRRFRTEMAFCVVSGSAA